MYLLSVLNSQYAFRLPLSRNTFPIHKANFSLPSEVDIYLPLVYCIASFFFLLWDSGHQETKCFHLPFWTMSAFLSLLPPFYTTKDNLKSLFHWCLFCIFPPLATLTFQDSMLLLTAPHTFFHLFFLPLVFLPWFSFADASSLGVEAKSRQVSTSEGWIVHTCIHLQSSRYTLHTDMYLLLIPF